jgi:DNA-binding MarR family transcriptional regulator
MQNQAADTGLLLQHITSLLTKKLDQVLQSELGIGYSQLRVMQIIGDSPKIQQRDIAASLAQTEASISRQIKLMISMGLLSINKDPLNKKSRRSLLTSKGQLIMNKSTKILNSYYSLAFGELTNNDLKRLDKQLKSFVR